jgi:hypothetical protein
MSTATCPSCGRDAPVFDTRVIEGKRKRFGLHSDSDGDYCWQSDRLVGTSPAFGPT